MVEAVLPLRRPALAGRRPGPVPPPPSRLTGRNADWRHLDNPDIISMPDKWEYPWYAAWDLAFHCDHARPSTPSSPRSSCVLITREWYMHPNGQLPAYEWDFGDVNPPVHALAALQVFLNRRRHRLRLAGADFPQAAAQLHLVGERQGSGRRQRVRRRVPRDGQRRSLRSLARAAAGADARAGRRHRVDGDLLPRHAGDRADAGRSRRRIRGRRSQVLRAFLDDRRCDQRTVCGTRTTASTTTRFAGSPTTPPIRCGFGR